MRPRANSQPSREPAGDYAPSVAEEGGRAKAFGIDRQLAATSRAPKAMSSQTFRTDTGLDAEVPGATEEPSRSLQAIAATVKRYQSSIKYVYNRELLSNPNLGGEDDGRLRDPAGRDRRLRCGPEAHAELASAGRAVKKRMHHWRFSRSPGGPVRVVFPFVFHPEM